MRAAVLHEFGGDLVIERHWADPEPGPNDAILQVKAVGVGLTILIMTSHAEIGETLKLVQQGQIKAVVSRTYGLGEVNQAHDALRRGQSLGRLALLV